MSKPAEKYTLTIESTPDNVPAINRLRRLLKALIRAYGFRCLEVVEVKPAEPVPVKADGDAA